ncbi:20s proteasome subunit beta type-1 [Spraguea lophii 42_110]|uniref:20s proteasome subunit beta type-1 n=1 Tax=Spraguea lophii (strain 42_110) TaxID=1358809 RepID=S7WAJ2_SPRLO|nr:20s proteasome subunit beta type-1 [Spraguea lophii 42_110]
MIKNYNPVIFLFLLKNKHSFMPMLVEKDLFISHEVKEEDVYDNNTGTTLCLSLDNCLVFSADTRHSTGSLINSRESSKIFRYKNIIFCGTGFYADVYEVFQRLKYEIIVYEQRNGPMKISSAAHLLFNILYTRRFFPYYVFCSLGGYEKTSDEFLLYSFDCIGSYSLNKCRVDGSAASMIQPLLDSLINKRNWNKEVDPSLLDIDKNKAIEIVRSSFNAAAERDVKTGDYLEIIVVERSGMERMVYDLRKD